MTGGLSLLCPGLPLSLTEAAASLGFHSPQLHSHTKHINPVMASSDSIHSRSVKHPRYIAEALRDKLAFQRETWASQFHAYTSWTASRGCFKRCCTSPTCMQRWATAISNSLFHARECTSMCALMADEPSLVCTTYI